MQSSQLEQPFYLRTLQAAQRATATLQPTHFLYHYQPGTGITLATYLAWLRPEQRLYLILEHRSTDDALAKWAHHNLPNVVVIPHYPAGLTHYLLDNLYQGTTATQPQPPVLVSNISTQAWHALGAMVFQTTDLLLIQALRHSQYLPEIPRVIGVHFQGQLPYNCSLHEVQQHLTRMCRAVNHTYTCFECFGWFIGSLSIYDRATLSQIALEHQSFCFFPLDMLSLEHLKSIVDADYAFALQHALDAQILQDNINLSKTRYATVISIDLRRLVPLALDHEYRLHHVLTHQPTALQSPPNLVCIFQPQLCNYELLSCCELVISAAYHQLKVAPHVKAYFISDYNWIMAYLQSLDAFDELVALGVQFQDRDTVLQQLNPETIVIHFGFEDALATAPSTQHYTSSMMYVLLAALRGELFIDGNTVISTALYQRLFIKKTERTDAFTVNELVYYRHWSWLWEKCTLYILFARQCLAEQIFIGSKEWHLLPIEKTPVPPLPPLILHDHPHHATPVQRLPVLTTVNLIACAAQSPVFCVWSKHISVAMLTDQVAFYVADAYDTQVYHHIILRGGMPLVYDVDKLAAKQIDSCTIVSQNYLKRLPKSLILHLKMSDQTRCSIRVKCAIKNAAHHALYLSNVIANF